MRAQELLTSSIPSITLLCSVGEAQVSATENEGQNQDDDVWVNAGDAVLEWELARHFSSPEVVGLVSGFEPLADSQSFFVPVSAQRDYCSADDCSERATCACTGCEYGLCESCRSTHDPQHGAGVIESESGGSKSDNGKEQQKKDLAAKRALLKTALFGKSAEERGANTQQLYTMLCECAGTEAPPGLQATNLKPFAPLLLAKALAEVNAIFTLFLSRVPLSTTNIHFNLTTNDFTRGGSSPWPVLKWDDPRIPCLRRCLELVLAIFKGQGDLTGPCLNAIVRRYRPGDLIGFHTDRKDYTDEIFGLVLENLSPQHGLIFYKDGKDPYFVHEPAGTAYCFRGAARWDYLHGYHCPEGLSSQSVRTSVSFRFFSDVKYAPEYDPANDV